MGRMEEGRRKGGRKGKGEKERKKGEGKREEMSCYPEDQVSGLALGAPLNHSESPFLYSVKWAQ